MSCAAEPARCGSTAVMCVRGRREEPGVGPGILTSHFVAKYGPEAKHAISSGSQDA